MITTDHERIKKWIQVNNGKPEILHDPDSPPDMVKLRINFPGNTDENHVPDRKVRQGVGWRDFFEIFEQQNLAFEYYDDTIDTHPIAKYRFFHRESIR